MGQRGRSVLYGLLWGRERSCYGSLWGRGFQPSVTCLGGKRGMRHRKTGEVETPESELLNLSVQPA